MHKKRIASLILAGVMLVTNTGTVYAAQGSEYGKELSSAADEGIEQMNLCGGAGEKDETAVEDDDIFSPDGNVVLKSEEVINSCETDAAPNSYDTLSPVDALNTSDKESLDPDASSDALNSDDDLSLDDKESLDPDALDNLDPDNDVSPDGISSPDGTLDPDALSLDDEEIVDPDLLNPDGILDPDDTLTPDAATKTNKSDVKTAEPVELYTGYVPVEDPIPIHRNHDDEELLYGDDELPEKYQTELLPPLRNQSPYGTCWAFAATALEEISLLKEGQMEDPDLSELHLAYFAYNSVIDPLGGTRGDSVTTPKSKLLNRGGNYEMAFATLGQWMGAADENTARYDRDDITAMSSGLQDAIAYDDAAHVQDYYMEDVDMPLFRQSRNLSLLDPIKRMVRDYGAAGIVFSVKNGLAPDTSSSIYNRDYNCYYNNGTSANLHAVTIVGWDDTFSKERFSTTPPGDGAFLIRNSWTTEDSSYKNSFSGYFWMSYYENTLQDRFYALRAEAVDHYDNNYQYDGGTSTAYRLENAGANVFTLGADGGESGEYLTAVSFLSTGANVNYTIEVYADVEDAPDTGEICEMSTTTGTTEYAGLITVPLNRIIYLEAGEKFAVAVKMDEPDLARQVSYSYGGIEVTSHPGESYRYHDGVWTDMEDEGNYKIKAYTCNAGPTEYVNPTDIEFLNVEGNELNLSAGEVFKVSTKVVPGDASDRNIVWDSSDTAVAKVNNGQIIAGKAGEATITASLSGGLVLKEINLTVEERLNGIAVTKSQVWDLISGDTYYQYNIGVSPKTYKPKSKPVYTSSDEDVITVANNGRITEYMMGKSTVTVSLDGVTTEDEHFVTASWDYFDYDVSPDKTVTLKWKAAKNAERYTIWRNGQYIRSVEDDGSATYEYVDDYFVGSTTQKAYYYFSPVIDDDYELISFNVVLGDKYNITYHVGDGINDPRNPSTYISGRSYTLHKPTPPEDYVFGGWYTDAEHTDYKGTISATDTGDLEFYAYYYEKPPELNVDKSQINLSKGKSTTVTATYTPTHGDEEYTWTSIDSRYFTITPNGNTATITAGSESGTSHVQVECNGLISYVYVTVQDDITLNPAKLTLKTGTTGHVYSSVTDDHGDCYIDWSSSDESVATVVDGEITAASDLDEAKEIAITATIEGTEFSATSLVTVLPITKVSLPQAHINGKEIDEGTTAVDMGSYFSLSTSTEGALIFYTLDGKEPLVSQDGVPQGDSTMLYQEALKIEEGTVIKTLAFKQGAQKSNIRTFEFTINDDNWGDIDDDDIRTGIFNDRSSLVPAGVWYCFRKQDGSIMEAIFTGSAVTDLTREYTAGKITFNEDIYAFQGTRRLVEGRDYTITYKNNTKICRSTEKAAPTVTVKGKGSFTGTAAFTFGITRTNINNAVLLTETEIAVLTGPKVKLSATAPKLTFAGKTLKAGKDYGLTYYEGDADGTPIPNPAAQILNVPGKTYTIVISALDTSPFYTDLYQQITITTKDPAKTVSAAKLKVVDGKGKAIKLAYTGKAVDLDTLFDNAGDDKTPGAFVKYGKEILTYGTDYKVLAIEEAFDYTSAGKHSFVIRGIDKENPDETSYCGDKTETMEITGIAMSKVKIAGLSTSVEYTGEVITLKDLFNPKDKNLNPDWNEVTLYYVDPTTKAKVPLKMIDPDDKDDPDNDTDDERVSGYTVSAITAVNAGKFTLTFTGADGVSGTIKKTITVKAYNVKNNTRGRLTIETDDAYYSKAGAKPEVRVSLITEEAPDGTPQKTITLKEGIDYTLVYKNNTKVAASGDKSAPTVTVKGCGNFTGSNASTKFTISKAPISTADLVASDITFMQNPTVGYYLTAAKAFQDGKALTVGKGKDIEALYKNDIEYTYAADTRLNDYYTTRYEGETVNPTDRLLPGTVIKVSIRLSKLTLSDKSPFTHVDGEKSSDTICGYYRIVSGYSDYNLAKFKVQLKDSSKLSFDSGDSVILTESDFLVTRTAAGQAEQIDVSNYRIKSVTGNRFIGKTTVVLEGRGDYFGTKNLSLKLGSRKVSGN